MRRRLLLLTVGVTFAAALLAPAAHAERLIVTPAGEVTLVSLGVVTFEALSTSVRCEMTLSGSLGREFVTTRGTSVGSITRATDRCSGGTITPLVEARAPWRVVYEAVDGTFPDRVTGYQLRLEAVRMLAEIGGFSSCLYTGELVGDLATTYLEPEAGDLRSRTGLVRLLTEQARFSRIVRLGGFLNCPERPTVAGTFRLEPQQTFEQAETQVQITFPPSITYTAIPETRQATLVNLGNRPISIERWYKTGTNPERFTINYMGAGKCDINDIIARNGGSCNVFITFNGPSPATAAVNVDINESNTSPFASGTLSG